jgi:hypothetical protein
MNPSNQLLGYINSLDWSVGKTKHEQTHLALLRAAGLGLLPSEACRVVAEKVVGTGGRLDPRGIVRQCERAYAYVTEEAVAKLPSDMISMSNGTYAKASRREFSFDRLKEMTASFEGEISREWFLERSPKRPGTAHEFLSELYPVEERVAILTKFRQRKPDLIWNHDLPDFGQLASDEGVFFLPNPITGNRHLVSRLKSETNPEGESWRCEEAVASWRFMLLESDLEEADFPGVTKAWLRLLALLPAPIVSIVGSGKKSCHALVRTDAVSKENWDAKVQPLKESLRELGADVGALSAVRLSRLPFGIRNGRMQECHYCDPDATSIPIASRFQGRTSNG